MSYTIRDLGIGMGAYMRLEPRGEPFVLRENQLINVGSTLLLVSIMDSLDEETTPAFMDVTNVQARVAVARNPHIPLLKLKVVGGPAHGNFYVRNPLDSCKQHVLGRIDKNDIYIADEVISTHHCTFQYQPGPVPNTDLNEQGPKDPSSRGFEGHWVLKDGYGMKGSLNGTWVYLSQESPITNKMTIKASEILFETNLIN